MHTYTVCRKNSFLLILTALVATKAFAGSGPQQLDLFAAQPATACVEPLKPTTPAKETVGYYFLRQKSSWVTAPKGFVAVVEISGAVDGKHPEWSKNTLHLTQGSDHEVFVESSNKPILRGDIKYRIHSNNASSQMILDAGNSYVPETSSGVEFHALPEKTRDHLIRFPLWAHTMGSLRTYNFDDGEIKTDKSGLEIPPSVLEFARNIKAELTNELYVDEFQGMGQGNGWVTIGHVKYNFEIIVHVDGTVLGGVVNAVQERGQYRDDSDVDPISGAHRKSHFANFDEAKANDIDFKGIFGWAAHGHAEKLADGHLRTLSMDNSFTFLGY